MAQVQSVTDVTAHILKHEPLHALVSIVALGRVPTTGWTHPRLAARFYIVPPADGIWDFDMLADAPTGIVGQVILPISAHVVVTAPSWCKGVRVHAATNAVEARLTAAQLAAAAEPETKALAGGHVIVRRDIGSYDDSFQPAGVCKWDPLPHFRMKKLHHHLVLTVEGPDEAHINDCIKKAIAAGLLAAIIAAFATLGLALPAAIAAFLKVLTLCLGAGFTVRIDDDSHWEYWCT